MNKPSRLLTEDDLERLRGLVSMHEVSTGASYLDIDVINNWFESLTVHQPEKPVEKVQSSIKAWHQSIFDQQSLKDRKTSIALFMESAASLVKSQGLSPRDAQLILHLVYDSNHADIQTTIGQVLVWLSTLSTAGFADMENCANQELDRLKNKTPEEIANSRILQRHPATADR